MKYDNLNCYTKNHSTKNSSSDSSKLESPKKNSSLLSKINKNNNKKEKKKNQFSNLNGNLMDKNKNINFNNKKTKLKNNLKNLEEQEQEEDEDYNISEDSEFIHNGQEKKYINKKNFMYGLNQISQLIYTYDNKNKFLDLNEGYSSEDSIIKTDMKYLITIKKIEENMNFENKKKMKLNKVYDAENSINLINKVSNNYNQKNYFNSLNSNFSNNDKNNKNGESNITDKISINSSEESNENISYDSWTKIDNDKRKKNKGITDTKNKYNIKSKINKLHSADKSSNSNEEVNYPNKKIKKNKSLCSYVNQIENQINGLDSNNEDDENQEDDLEQNFEDENIIDNYEYKNNTQFVIILDENYLPSNITSKSLINLENFKYENNFAKLIDISSHKEQYNKINVENDENFIEIQQKINKEEDNIITNSFNLNNFINELSEENDNKIHEIENKEIINKEFFDIEIRQTNK